MTLPLQTKNYLDTNILVNHVSKSTLLVLNSWYVVSTTYVCTN